MGGRAQIIHSGAVHRSGDRRRQLAAPHASRPESKSQWDCQLCIMHNRETISRLLASTVGDGDSFSLGSLIHCAPISRAFCLMSNMTGRERWSLSATYHEPSALPGSRVKRTFENVVAIIAPNTYGRVFPVAMPGSYRSPRSVRLSGWTQRLPMPRRSAGSRGGCGGRSVTLRVWRGSCCPSAGVPESGQCYAVREAARREREHNGCAGQPDEQVGR